MATVRVSIARAALGDFRGEASLKTWLRRIAYNLFLDSQRQRRRAEALVDKLSQARPDAADDPLSRVMEDEHLARMCRAMDSLDGDERAMLLLHYMDGLSYREMARVLHQPAGCWQPTITACGRRTSTLWTATA